MNAEYQTAKQIVLLLLGMKKMLLIYYLMIWKLNFPSHKYNNDLAT